MTSVLYVLGQVRGLRDTSIIRIDIGCISLPFAYCRLYYSYEGCCFGLGLALAPQLQGCEPSNPACLPDDTPVGVSWGSLVSMVSCLALV